MSKTRRWLVLATVSAGLLTVSVDTTVLYTALPALTGWSWPAAPSACSPRRRAWSRSKHAGHFLQLERPGEVNDHILAWVTG